MKYDYYVAILEEGNLLKYITSVDYTTKTWLAERGKSALKMTKTRAEELCHGLIANMCPAVILQAPKGCLILTNL